MSFLLAIEGADGAGKATASAAVAARLNAAGTRATVISFPRYAETVGGHMLGELLSGRLPRTASPQAAAVLYALDRYESRDHLARAAAENDVIVFDRYIASNMVYQASKVPADEAAALMGWIVALETVQFALPAPDLSIFLDTPLDRARRQVLQKQQRSYTDRGLDENEADDALQARVRANYAAIGATGMLGAWATVSTMADGAMRTPDAIAAEIVAAYRAQVAGGL